MGLIVQKFGGTSVKDRDRIFNVARIVANTRNQGNDVVVVVSAGVVVACGDGLQRQHLVYGVV